ncbi:N-acyl homoserine lactonase family protein [Lawsonibacter sp. OA9]|uniref:N-acyl homoserine lactonase family protein n=1 Tax=Eubacteriales TaxID=186802 RepID=UPI000820417C|nr:N-acyl homoserine lactonase family protein [Lawsonibacter sp. OA9]SCH78409.1 N-acyl homoserine lactonase [uncultured Clostridium sp.]
MNYQIDLLTKVFPGKSSAGALGLSTCALLRAPGHTLLFDTAAHGVIKTIQNSLARLEVAPETVDTIFLSHMHYDHLNNAAYYPNAQIIVGRSEWEYATTSKDEWTPLESVLYLQHCRQVRLVDDGEEILPGIRAIWTPGHTPGHMSLAVDTPKGVVVLAGDAVKNRSELELEYSDQYVDQQASTASIKKIKSMAYKVLPGHDGYLLVQDGKVVPEQELVLDIMLPRGCMDGDNGVYHLSVK